MFLLQLLCKHGLLYPQTSYLVLIPDYLFFISEFQLDLCSVAEIFCCKEIESSLRKKDKITTKTMCSCLLAVVVVRVQESPCLSALQSHAYLCHFVDFDIT